MIQTSQTRLLQCLNDIKAQFGQITNTAILHELERHGYNWSECVVLSPEMVQYFVECVKSNRFDNVVTKDGQKYSNFAGFNLSGFMVVEAFLSTIVEYQKLNFDEIRQTCNIDNICTMVYLMIGGKTFDSLHYSVMSNYKDLDFFPKTKEAKIRLINYQNEISNLSKANELYQRIKDGFRRSGYYSDTEKIKDALGVDVPKKRINVQDSNNLLNMIKNNEHYKIHAAAYD